MDGKYQFCCSRGVVELKMMNDFLLHVEAHAAKVTLLSAIDMIYEHSTTRSCVVLRQEKSKRLEVLHSTCLQPNEQSLDAAPAFSIMRETRQTSTQGDTLAIQVGIADANTASILTSLNYKKIREMHEWAIAIDVAGGVRMLVVHVPKDDLHAIVELRSPVIEGDVIGARQRLKYVELIYSPFIQIIDANSGN